MKCGIIVGSDQTQEWLLPWWWENYARHSRHPVAFVDFGLSLEAKSWCRERGELIALRVVDFAAEKEEIDPHLAKSWEVQFGKFFWPSRGAWFKKPQACLQTPFDRSIWIDLDCEIRGEITPLFQFAEHPSGVAMAKDSFEDPRIYNSGVIVFREKPPLFEEWARESLVQNHLFRGDQELLSHLIVEKNVVIGEVPPLYNWSRCLGDQPEAVIYHWHGEQGRNVIKHRLWAAQLSE